MDAVDEFVAVLARGLADRQRGTDGVLACLSYQRIRLGKIPAVLDEPRDIPPGRHDIGVLAAIQHAEAIAQDLFHPRASRDKQAERHMPLNPIIQRLSGHTGHCLAPGRRTPERRLL